MNDKAANAIAAKANEAQLQIKYILNDLRQRFEGQCQRIDESKHSKADFLELSKVLMDAVVKLTAAEEKVAAAEIIRAFQ